MKLLASPTSSSSLLALATASCALTALLGAQPIHAARITFINRCERQIGLYDNAQEVPMAPGAALERTAVDGFKGMFRAGRNPQATLAEFTHAGGKLWFDISIIPTSPSQSPEYCPSLEACKQLTGGTGFNEPMQIAPQSNTNGAHCRVLTCLADGCADAYQYPKDDTKTHNCPETTDFVVTFCPGGAGGARAVPAPTSAPTPSTATPTPVPTTQPRTPVPTTAAPTPVPALSAANATVSVTGEADRIVGEDDSATLAATPIATEVNPELTGAPQKPVFETSGSAIADVVTRIDPVTPEPSSSTPSTKANTQSSNSSNGSTIATVFIAAVLALAAAVAVVVIAVVRRKKRALDAQTEKSPIMNPGLATL